MKALVCGGRDYSDAELVAVVLNYLNKDFNIGRVIDGDARGADRLAGRWARNRGIDNHKFPAQWGRYGKAAGHVRNKEMLDMGQPDIVVAFPGGRGTADMARIAREAEVPVFEVIEEQDGPLLRSRLRNFVDYVKLGTKVFRDPILVK